MKFKEYLKEVKLKIVVKKRGSDSYPKQIYIGGNSKKDLVAIVSQYKNQGSNKKYFEIEYYGVLKTNDNKVKNIKHDTFPKAKKFVVDLYNKLSINESKQKWSDNKVIKVLSKGLDYDDVFAQIAMSLRNYNQIDSGRIYLQKNNKKLMDELWYRTASAAERSERFDPKFMKILKKNFYSLEKTLFKNYKKVDNYFTEE